MATSSVEFAIYPMNNIVESYTDGPCKRTNGKKKDKFRPVGRSRKEEMAEKRERRVRQKAQTIRRFKQRAVYAEDNAGAVIAMPSKRAEQLTIEKALDEITAEYTEQRFGCDCGPHNAWTGEYDYWDDYPEPYCELCYTCMGRLDKNGKLHPYDRVVDDVRVELPSGSYVFRITLDPPPLRKKSLDAAADYAARCA